MFFEEQGFKVGDIVPILKKGYFEMTSNFGLAKIVEIKDYGMDVMCLKNKELILFNTHTTCKGNTYITIFKDYEDLMEKTGGCFTIKYVRKKELEEYNNKVKEYVKQGLKVYDKNGDGDMTTSEMKQEIADWKEAVITAYGETKTYVPGKSKFNTVDDVVDYLIATGFGITVKDGITKGKVDLETIKKYSKEV